MRTPAACKPRRSEPRLRQLEGGRLYSVENLETDRSQGRSALIHLADLEPQALYARSHDAAGRRFAECRTQWDETEAGVCHDGCSAFCTTFVEVE